MPPTPSAYAARVIYRVRREQAGAAGVRDIGDGDLAEEGGVAVAQAIVDASQLEGGQAEGGIHVEGPAEGAHGDVGSAAAQLGQAADEVRLGVVGLL